MAQYLGCCAAVWLRLWYCFHFLPQMFRWGRLSTFSSSCLLGDRQPLQIYFGHSPQQLLRVVASISPWQANGPDLIVCLAVFSHVWNIPRGGVRFLATWQSAFPNPLEAAARPVGTALVSESPESWHCHVAMWEGTWGALLLELGHGAMAAIMWAVLQAYMCLGVCNCERESREREPPSCLSAIQNTWGDAPKLQV